MAWAMRSGWTVKSKCQRRSMTSLVSLGRRLALSGRRSRMRWSWQARAEAIAQTGS
ncbi:hypothetical protein ABZV81_34255 [Streptomyces parvus]|uniref:Uncharacterized protein n=1 Tax=Streptomyces sp. JL1001 TaxID=3078227 RepID=A0AAU8K6Z2_9ACTN